MTTMQKRGYKKGDKFIYDNSKADTVDWFLDGSVITLTQSDDSDFTNTPSFEGPAKHGGVGGNKEQKGEITKGYAKLVCVTPLGDACGATFAATEIKSVTTTITVSRELTSVEKDAILAIVAGVRK